MLQWAMGSGAPLWWWPARCQVRWPAWQQSCRPNRKRPSCGVGCGRNNIRTSDNFPRLITFRSPVASADLAVAGQTAAGVSGCTGINRGKLSTVLILLLQPRLTACPTAFKTNFRKDMTSGY